MADIYLVSVDEYHYYRVLAVFSDPTKAEKFLAAIPEREGPKIEHFNLDDPQWAPIFAGYRTWSVMMHRDGTVFSCEPIQPQAPLFKQGPIQYGLWARIWARDANEAIAITDAFRLKLLAEDKWQSKGINEYPQELPCA